MLNIRYFPGTAPLTEKEMLAGLKRSDSLLDGKALADRYHDALGWIDTEQWAGSDWRTKLRSIAEAIRSETDVFAVVGIGGSNQGARAVIEACAYMEKEGPEIIYPALYLSAQEYKSCMRRADGKRLTVDIIAKNFRTLEPGVFFRLLREDMAARYGADEMKRRIVVTPTAGLDALDRIGKEYGYTMVPFPEDIGGRFSVFSPVGLLPIAVAGLDIDELVRGAADAQKDFEQQGGLSRQIREYAVRRNLLYEKGFDVEASVMFEPCLQALGKWWRQLFGESEGKDGKGIFPTIFLNTEELHSLGQYMQSGRRHVMETFLHIRTPICDRKIGDGMGADDGFDYLAGKQLNDLNEAAYRATVTAHSEGGVPCHIIEMDTLDEYHLGMYMYAMMRACYESSVLLGVNPFDQPGVEAYKTEMFRILKG